MLVLVEIVSWILEQLNIKMFAFLLANSTLVGITKISSVIQIVLKAIYVPPILCSIYL